MLAGQVSGSRLLSLIDPIDSEVAFAMPEALGALMADTQVLAAVQDIVGSQIEKEIAFPHLYTSSASVWEPGPPPGPLGSSSGCSGDRPGSTPELVASGGDS